MQCSCEIDVDNDGGPDFYYSKIVKARKEHVCYECCKTIQKSEKYEHVRGMWDGSFSTYKTCIDCLSLRKEFFSSGFIFGQIWDDFDSFLEDCSGEISEACIIELTPIAKGKVCEMIELYW